MLDKSTIEDVTAVRGGNPDSGIEKPFGGEVSGYHNKCRDDKGIIHFTRFPNEWALTKEEHSGTLSEIEELIRRTRKRTKQKLPYLKLARFSDKRSPKGSFRYDDNVLEITGVEGDYDSGDLTFDDACALVAKAGVWALLYPTPSNTPGEPGRFRVLAPTSAPLPPGQRARLSARLNGILKGGLAAESHTLSQAFHFGGVPDRPPVRTMITSGRPIDLCDELDSGAIGRPARKTAAGSKAPGAGGKGKPAWEEGALDVEAACEAIRTGENYHTSIMALAGYYSRQGESGERITSLLNALMHEVPDAKRDERWSDRLRGIPGQVAACLEYRQREDADMVNQFDDESDEAVADEDDGDEACAKELGITVAEWLKKYGAAKEYGDLTFTSPAECASLPRPSYVIKGLIASKQLGCIFGDPGCGKSLLGPRLGYSVAQGREAFGLRTKAGCVLYVASEDEAGMHGRVRALAAQHGDAPNFKVVGGVSDLLAEDSTDLKPLIGAVKDLRPKLIIIDTLAMAFPGLEENTAEGMGRVAAVSRALATFGAAVILIHHGTKAEGSTPRGHSLLNGALDMALLLKARDGNGVIRGKLTKNRNGTHDLDIAFKIGVRELGIDEDGDPITAAFAKELVGLEGAEAQKLSAPQRALLDHLDELSAEHSQVSESELHGAATDGCRVSAAEKRESRAKAVQRAFQALVGMRVIEIQGGSVCRVNSAADLFENVEDEDDAAP